MPDQPPFPVPTDQRLLAAIVFTDASGFSARAEIAESAALALLEQDFAAMRELCQEMSGTVLKSTGDGLLIYFTSAVHAVTWALRTQRAFAARARTSARGEVFRHRVGVHVGDVFLKDDDVMGDGVNVAARVQVEAPPGGICISQTVYELVKNKMELHVVRLEPRKLKNIREQVQLYHLLLEEPKRPAPVKVSLSPRPPPPAPVSPSRRLAGISLLLVGIVAGALFLRHMSSEHEEGLARSQAAQAALGAMLSERKSPAAPAAAAGGQIDFAKLTTGQPAGGADAAVLAQANAAVAALEAWRQGQLPHYTPDRPLLVRDLHGAMQDMTVYAEADGRLVFVEGRAKRLRDWASLPPELQGAIIVAAIRAAPDRAALRGAEAFAFVHGLPEMAAALARERSTEALFSR